MIPNLARYDTEQAVDWGRRVLGAHLLQNHGFDNDFLWSAGIQTLRLLHAEHHPELLEDLVSRSGWPL